MQKFILDNMNPDIIPSNVNNGFRLPDNLRSFWWSRDIAKINSEILRGEPINHTRNFPDVFRDFPSFTSQDQINAQQQVRSEFVAFREAIKREVLVKNKELVLFDFTNQVTDYRTIKKHDIHPAQFLKETVQALDNYVTAYREGGIPVANFLRLAKEEIFEADLGRLRRQTDNHPVISFIRDAWSNLPVVREMPSSRKETVGQPGNLSQYTKNIKYEGVSEEESRQQLLFAYINFFADVICAIKGYKFRNFQFNVHSWGVYSLNLTIGSKIGTSPLEENLIKFNSFILMFNEEFMGKGATGCMYRPFFTTKNTSIPPYILSDESIDGTFWMTPIMGSACVNYSTSKQAAVYLNLLDDCKTLLPPSNYTYVDAYGQLQNVLKKSKPLQFKTDSDPSWPEICAPLLVIGLNWPCQGVQRGEDRFLRWKKRGEYPEVGAAFANALTQFFGKLMLKDDRLDGVLKKLLQFYKTKCPVPFYLQVFYNEQPEFQNGGVRQEPLFKSVANELGLQQNDNLVRKYGMISEAINLNTDVGSNNFTYRVHLLKNIIDFNDIVTSFKTHTGRNERTDLLREIALRGLMKVEGTVFFNLYLVKGEEVKVNRPAATDLMISELFNKKISFDPGKGEFLIKKIKKNSLQILRQKFEQLGLVYLSKEDGAPNLGGLGPDGVGGGQEVEMELGGQQPRGEFIPNLPEGAPPQQPPPPPLPPVDAEPVAPEMIRKKRQRRAEVDGREEEEEEEEREEPRAKVVRVEREKFEFERPTPYNPDVFKELTVDEKLNEELHDEGMALLEPVESMEPRKFKAPTLPFTKPKPKKASKNVKMPQALLTKPTSKPLEWKSLFPAESAKKMREELRIKKENESVLQEGREALMEESVESTEPVWSDLAAAIVKNREPTPSSPPPRAVVESVKSFVPPPPTQELDSGEAMAKALGTKLTKIKKSKKKAVGKIDLRPKPSKKERERLTDLQQKEEDEFSRNLLEPPARTEPYEDLEISSAEEPRPPSRPPSGVPAQPLVVPYPSVPIEDVLPINRPAEKPRTKGKMRRVLTKQGREKEEENEFVDELLEAGEESMEPIEVDLTTVGELPPPVAKPSPYPPPLVVPKPTTPLLLPKTKEEQRKPRPKLADVSRRKLTPAGLERQRREDETRDEFLERVESLEPMEEDLRVRGEIPAAAPKPSPVPPPFVIPKPSQPLEVPVKKTSAGARPKLQDVARIKLTKAGLEKRKEEERIRDEYLEPVVSNEPTLTVLSKEKPSSRKVKKKVTPVIPQALLPGAKLRPLDISIAEELEEEVNQNIADDMIEDLTPRLPPPSLPANLREGYIPPPIDITKDLEEEIDQNIADDALERGLEAARSAPPPPRVPENLMPGVKLAPLGPLGLEPPPPQLPKELMPGVKLAPLGPLGLEEDMEAGVQKTVEEGGETIIDMTPGSKRRIIRIDTERTKRTIPKEFKKFLKESREKKKKLKMKASVSSQIEAVSGREAVESKISKGRGKTFTETKKRRRILEGAAAEARIFSAKKKEPPVSKKKESAGKRKDTSDGSEKPRRRILSKQEALQRIITSQR
ncbi:hypothetical protein AbHV_ORF18 [Abalone herpesvirus Victoria/AUS/2009]|uniref:Uncharacterized protein n=1 Tax=Abalone herpesvirus (isolate Abalone/Australia/Victoria/2009) TaxID=1241371 RepID=K4JYE9_ABHV|nr:hypothetical protein AbHV_ORF18 [Abalone herpesvirus Victoria/AUS/2009]AFU90028.1 hypothetical protein AbHV_ORF18 [Abalone herpesvirus Victoria/AUS/2009]